MLRLQSITKRNQRQINYPSTYLEYKTMILGYMTAGKTLSDYTDLFSPSYNKKNGKIIYKYLKDKYNKRKHKPGL